MSFQSQCFSGICISIKQKSECEVINLDQGLILAEESSVRTAYLKFNPQLNLLKSGLTSSQKVPHSLIEKFEIKNYFRLFNYSVGFPECTKKSQKIDRKKVFFNCFRPILTIHSIVGLFITTHWTTHSNKNWKFPNGHFLSFQTIIIPFSADQSVL